ncbi:MAG: glycosyl hydrolase family 5 [Micromonosporaceae bacterium]|nr:glycosyl hydrolase family 5 [Micromonosporaceae bacterium]
MSALLHGSASTATVSGFEIETSRLLTSGCRAANLGGRRSWERSRGYRLREVGHVTIQLRVLAASLAATTLTITLAVGAPAHAQDDPPELIVNGDFTDGTAPWWWTGNLAAGAADGQLCTEVPGGTTNPWDAIIGQDNLPLQAGESYRFAVTASASRPVTVRALVQQPVDPFPTQLDERPLLGPDPQTFEFGFTSTVDWDDAQVAFQIGGQAEPWTFCLDRVSLTGGAPPPDFTPETGPRVRVNQVGYLPHGPKHATVVTGATEALPWELRDAAGTVLATGQTAPAGLDPTSDQTVHTVDFSGVSATGAGFTLTADGETSYPFAIDGGIYQPLRTDALALYYTQRSGLEILDPLASGYARPAGHVGMAPNQGDLAVPCFQGTCDYTLDVSGGWYDAGDHGKYVVNGGISAWQVMNIWERATLAPTGSPDALGDGSLSIPEQGNGVPDVLDEARWEIEFLLSMQVPDGEPLAGMAHHKVHDVAWTGLPLLPHLDPQPRFLHPPSTAATLNLAAVGAQCARLFAPYDSGFAGRCRAAAETAWDAAVANPDRLALAENEGGGGYTDDVVADEFYWAAAELFLTTGAADYRDAVLTSPLHTGDAFRPEGFDWRWTAPLGRLQLATVPNELPGREQVRASVVAAAEDYLATLQAHPYGLAYAPTSGRFDWGSNNLVLNNLAVLATAFDLTGDQRFRDGALTGIDYLLGRNALNQSYLTGYGTVASENQHSRWYAHQLDPSLPHPPDGTLAGGPNSSIQDPVAQQRLQGCPPQFCYIDHIDSWSTNELTINWNSTMAWNASFLADLGDAALPGCAVDYHAVRSLPGVFAAAVVVHNTGPEPVEGWTLAWSFPAGQRVLVGIGAAVRQTGPEVTATGRPWNATIPPGRSVQFGLLGKAGGDADPAPTQFTLNGTACT